MKLIIDISNYELNEVQNGSIASNEILKAVRNGIPYKPKGECCGSCYLCDVSDCGADMRKGGAE